jgi:hypothetical protein
LEDGREGFLGRYLTIKSFKKPNFQSKVNSIPTIFIIK